MWCLCCSFCLWCSFCNSTSSFLASNAKPFSPVLLYNTDNSCVIAWGVLSPDSTHCFDGINVTATHCPVEIYDIYIPGAIITTYRQQPLAEFGQTPFSIVCLCTHLCTASFQFPHQNLLWKPAVPKILIKNIYWTLHWLTSQLLTHRTQNLKSTSLKILASAVLFWTILTQWVMTAEDMPMLATFEVDLTSQQNGKQILGQVDDHS